jgi:hypothetical protein
MIFVACPTCKQKLAFHDYVVEGSEMVCANPRCETVLRLVQRKPPKVEVVPFEATRNPNSRPESYG